ncbi:hypothetical protein GQ457_08G004460 [Hibiscus cannabinus]
MIHLLQVGSFALNRQSGNLISIATTGAGSGSGTLSLFFISSHYTAFSTNPLPKFKVLIPKKKKKTFSLTVNGFGAIRW